MMFTVDDIQLGMWLLLCVNVSVRLTAGGPGRALAVGALRGMEVVYTAVGRDVTIDRCDHRSGRLRVRTFVIVTVLGAGPHGRCER